MNSVHRALAALSALSLIAAAGTAEAQNRRRAPAAAPAPSSLQTAVQLRERALADRTAWELVESLTTEIGPRPGGSPAYDRASAWAAARLRALGFENVRIESFPMNVWTRGEERAWVVGAPAQPLAVTALGGSVATPAEGVEAEVVVFPTFETMLAAAPGSLTGKIAVVAERMARTQDGEGYGAASRVRVAGASEAARRGAVAYLARSLGTEESRDPHTGVMRYAEDAPRIPAAALSTTDAEQIERLAALGRPVRVRLVLTPTMQTNGRSHNVVGEIRGRERPNEVVLLGAHLDSWDLGTGAIDDGAGVAIVTAAAHLIGELPRAPRRTIRVVLFGAEETGEAGPAYVEQNRVGMGNIVAASESDFGADVVYRWSLPAGAQTGALARDMEAALRPLRIYPSGRPATSGGPDIGPMQRVGVPVFRLDQDGTRYFDLHHTAEDTLDKIDPEQLQQNVAAWAALTYLLAESDVDFRALAPAPAAPR